jgi:Leucine-rich repeat (LRR) protein
MAFGLFKWGSSKVPVHFEQGTYGPRAVLQSAWSDAIGTEIKRQACTEIEINDGKGWKGADLSFLAKFPELKGLKIIDLRIPSVKPIHLLSELRELDVMTYCDTAIDFSSFPMLEKCSIEWRKGCESLFERTGLKDLFVNKYKGKTASPFGQLANLESLAIFNAPIQDIQGLGSLKKLRQLHLANLRRLRSLAGLENLTDLEELEVATCRRIESIDEIGLLSRLRKLSFLNNNDIESLKPIDRIDTLESIFFYDSTNIVDGDLSPLTRQKNLSRVSFQNRRHYSHKREDFGEAYFGRK